MDRDWKSRDEYERKRIENEKKNEISINRTRREEGRHGILRNEKTRVL